MASVAFLISKAARLAQTEIHVFNVENFCLCPGHASIYRSKHSIGIFSVAVQLLVHLCGAEPCLVIRPYYFVSFPLFFPLVDLARLPHIL